MATFNPNAPSIDEIHPSGMFATNSVKLEATITNEQEGKPGSGGRSMLVITIRTDLGDGGEGYLVDRMVFTPETAPSDFPMRKLVDFCRATDTIELLMEDGQGKDVSDLEVLNDFANTVSALGVAPTVQVSHSKRKDNGELQANVRNYYAANSAAPIKLEQAELPVMKNRPKKIKDTEPPF